MSVLALRAMGEWNEIATENVPAMPQNDDLIADLSELCIELAVEAASTARLPLPSANFHIGDKSSATDLVTPFDQAAERFIRAQLSPSVRTMELSAKKRVTSPGQAD